MCAFTKPASRLVAMLKRLATARQIRCKAEADGTVRMGEGLAYRWILSALSPLRDRVSSLSLSTKGQTNSVLLSFCLPHKPPRFS